MRDHKFKVWDKVTKRMSDSFSVFGEFTLLGAVHDWQKEGYDGEKGSIQRLADLELLQFTGLKDSKGKEIYEGDIVSEYRLNETFRKYTVQYDNDTARFELVNKKMGWRHGVNIGGALYFLINDVSPLEVIGNIYENSELL